MKALITGINGFAGSWLADELLKKKAKVAGTVQPGTGTENIDHVKNDLSLFKVDLLDKKGLEKVLSSSSPDVIFHLAGASSVKESFTDPKKSIDINVNGSLNLFEAVKNFAPQATLLLVTSSEIYGESLSPDIVTDENSLIRPKSPYAVSKAALDMMGRVYSLSNELKIVIARPFSHVGPRQNNNYFVSTVACQIAEIIKGAMSAEINLGNLEVYRDFTDVRDMVRAYILLAQKGRAGEAYNICSGQSYLLKDLVNNLIELSKKKISVKLDLARLRKTDLYNMKLSNAKIKAETGWEPRIKIKQTLQDTLDYWLTRA